MQKYKTCFGIEVSAAELLKVDSVADLQALLSTADSLKDFTVVGGGSNIIFDDASSHKIILIDIKGIAYHTSLGFGKIHGAFNLEEVVIKVGAGEVWDEVVAFAVERNLQGIEALSAIPGTAGAAPVQNIGAYGTEIKDVLEKVEVVDRATGELRVLENKDCKFSYRNSIFKNEFKNKYIITAIYLKLKKSATAEIPKYKEVQKFFEGDSRVQIPLLEIRNVITEIRWNKLPRPELLPNVGSFFHNPILNHEQLIDLQKILPNVPTYQNEDGNFKVAAGYLMDQAGLKGFTQGEVGTYEKNALVLVNAGQANFEQLQIFINFVQETVFAKYGVRLLVEPELV
jgi:UDP-N-acetylmuramate dehydrogenase